MSRKSPNIVFVFADQLRASSVGCYGQEAVRTPHLDAFAAQGTRLTRAFSNTPVCCPARASLLTGLHTLSHGVVFNDTPLRTDVTSIAHSLGDAGYRCGYIGKWHLDTADRSVFVPPGPRRQGFDDYWAAANCTHRYFESYAYINDSPEPVWMDGYEPDWQTGLATDYLRSRAGGGQPFCLFLSWGPPHCPYEAVPKGFRDLYPESSIRLRANAAPHADRSVVAGYYAHITALDECFGRILRELAALGLEKDTIVVFTSDHGDMLYSHDRGWKCKPWLESTNIPFCIRWPGRVPAGAVRDTPVGLVDVMPTLLEFAGVPAPASAEGVSAAPALRGESPGAESVLLDMPVVPQVYSFREWRGVATRTHTYATFRDRPWILHDDIADPCQMRNLVDEPGHEHLRRRMDALLREWLARTGDAFETSEEVAARLYPGHERCVIPFYENEPFRQARERRFRGRA